MASDDGLIRRVCAQRVIGYFLRLFISTEPDLRFAAEEDQQKINLRAQRFAAGDKKFKAKLSIDQLIKSTVSWLVVVMRWGELIMSLNFW